MSKNRKNRFVPKSRLRAKLTFDEGMAEYPVYSIKAFTNEKEKGINMLKLIEDNFEISDEDRRDYIRRKLEEWDKDSMKPTDYPKGFRTEPFKWTKDERGNIISPFSDKAKELKEKMKSE